MRESASAARRAASGDGERAARLLCGRFFSAFEDELDSNPRAVVSGYWPMRDELDDRMLLRQLSERGFRCALPIVVERGQPLVFRHWAPGDALVAAPFGTRAPSDDAEELTPGIVLAPLLAVDARGCRLGYGAGYYDRTLRHLRERGPILAIGIGFDAQLLDAVPCDDGDERLDWVVTDKRTLRCAV